MGASISGVVRTIKMVAPVDQVRVRIIPIYQAQKGHIQQDIASMVYVLMNTRLMTKNIQIVMEFFIIGVKIELVTSEHLEATEMLNSARGKVGLKHCV